MALIKCSYVEIHAPLFLAGTNLGQKLGIKHPVVVFHDDEKDKIVVDYKGKKARLSMSTVHSYEYEHENGSQKYVVGITGSVPTGKAQVSTPMDHVFQGEGKGQTGAPVPKTAKK